MEECVCEYHKIIPEKYHDFQRGVKANHKEFGLVEIACHPFKSVGKWVVGVKGRGLGVFCDDLELIQEAA